MMFNWDLKDDLELARTEDEGEKKNISEGWNIKCKSPAAVKNSSHLKN